MPPLEEVEKAAGLGMTREEIAAHFGVDARTIYRRRRQFVQFCQLLDRGRAHAGMLMGNVVFQAALKGKNEAN